MPKIVNCFCSINHYRPQRSCEGYDMFLHLSVILFTGGGSASVHAGIPSPQSRHPPGPGTPPPGPGSSGADTPSPGTRQPPEQTPPGADTPREQTPLPRPGTLPGRRLQLRTVRILLECILVTFKFTPTKVRYKVHIWLSISLYQKIVCLQCDNTAQLNWLSLSQYFAKITYLSR